MTRKFNRSLLGHPSSDWWIDARMIAPMRLVLAATALLIIYIDPSQPDRLVALSYSLMIAYTVFSAIILVLAFTAPHLLPVKILHWLDLGWYVALISVSSGTSSIFFIFFFFAILVASFRSGFRSGLRITIISTVLFVTLGYLTAPPAEFEWNRFLLRAVTLLGLGYMISHWGGSEIELKRRLRLLKDVTDLSNPRFGIERTIRSGLERLRSFYDARAAILIQRRDQSDQYELTRVEAFKPDLPTEDISDELARSLLSPAPDMAVMRARAPSAAMLHNIETGQTWTERLDQTEAIINTLEARSFTSVPIRYHGEFTGRLYVVDSRRRINPTDIEFMLQVVEHVTPLLENIRLLDTLASEAAEHERKKLARDIHDSVIQPYVGLQFGLAAVRQKLMNENSAAFKEVSELCEVANEEVRSLRHFLDELKVEEARYGVLFPAVRRFAARYSAATGIAVRISGEEDLHLNDRLAAEVFQMITEALSNVRRHTLAQAAEIEIRCDDRNLLVTVSNDNANGASPKPFRPASLTERARALGGSAQVQTDSDNRTVIAIRIPL